MSELVVLAVASAAFLGSHFLLSHPLRTQLVGLLGERRFLAVYSLVAFLFFGLMLLSWYNAPGTLPLWPVGDGLWWAGTFLTLVATLLFLGSFAGNPALPAPGIAPRIPDQARGAFAITRHPMMWGFALWGIAHILVYPVAANIIFAGAITFLALAGSLLQDRKKTRLQPALWPVWQARTSWLPFVAILTRRARLKASWPGWQVVVGSVLLWLGASWAHFPLAGFQAGVWRWFPFG
jgi:uncharacterized membrane protein